MLVILLMELLVLVEGYDTNAYTLGNNLVANPSFLSPQIPRGIFFLKYYYHITNWACLKECMIMNMANACSQAGVACTIYFTQGLNLDTKSQLNGIRQTIPIYTTGQYLLQILWLPPLKSPVKKNLKI